MKLANWWKVLGSDSPLGEPAYTASTRDFVQEVSLANSEMQISIILIGSVARGAQNPESDLDLLVVSNGSPRIERHPDRLHVQTFTAQQFTERLRSGDDFAGWCVRYGVPLVVNKLWFDIVNSSDAALWPDWRRKIHHAARRLTIATALLKTGDLAAAREELLYAVSHTARAVLLRHGIFPLSRPEMIGQLREANQDRLSKILEELSNREPTGSMLNRCWMYLKRFLISLDKPAYRDFAELRRKHRLAKKKFLT
jgi:Nucleotidyltransferase domain